SFVLKAYDVAPATGVKLGKDEGTSFAFDLHAPRFFDEVEFVIDLDFIQRYSKRFINHALLQI
ncbi:hypothetical protein Tco_1472963, partial [Tanacetum coccineum]